MKDYSKSIAYMKQEKFKHTEPHQIPYADAIEAMELVNPIEVTNRTTAYLCCPRCGKEFTYRGLMEFEHGTRICNACGQHMKWGKNYA